MNGYLQQVRIDALNERYCRTAEAAQITGLNVDTLKRLVRQGEILAQHYGNTLLFEREAIARYHPRPTGAPGKIYSCVRCGTWVTPGGDGRKGREMCPRCYSRAQDRELSAGEFGR